MKTDANALPSDEFSRSGTHDDADVEQAFHLRRMSAAVVPAYLALALPPLSLLLAVGLIAAAWCGVSGDAISAIAGATSVLCLIVQRREPVRATRQRWVAHGVIALIAAGVASSLHGAPQWWVASLFSVLLASAGCVGMYRLLSGYQAAAERMRSYLDSASDAALLDAMNPEAANVANAWLQGRLETSPRVEDVICLALLDVALREALGLAD